MGARDWRSLRKGKAREDEKRSSHPYLIGNFRPVEKEHHLTPCTVVEGSIPRELWGGQYIRNGGNPAFPPKEKTAYHWFDGDGMLHGVHFRISTTADGVHSVEPHYTNRYIQTDVFLASKTRGSTILPSISSLLISPSDSLGTKAALVPMLIRTVAIAYLSSLTRLSVTNTAVYFHNRRLLATCESGPPMRIALPELTTVGWYVHPDENGEGGLGRGELTVGAKEWIGAGRFAGAMLEEWQTGHPKLDPISGEFLTYGYNIFARPYVTYSVIGPHSEHRIFKQPVEIPTAKMMHDWGVSRKHTIIMDLPLTMSPFNIAKGLKPMVYFNRKLKSRFGIMPRYFSGQQSDIRWYETDPCLIFHTANAFDETDEAGAVNAVSLLACRFATAKLVHAAGGRPAPAQEEAIAAALPDGDIVRLTYYRFDLSTSKNTITHEFALSNIPYEFPVANPAAVMRETQYLYGCTMRRGRFDEAMRAAKIDSFVKFDSRALVAKGKAQGFTRSGIVDTRSVMDVIEQQSTYGPDHVPTDPVRIYALPAHHYAQEPAFVARQDASAEDDGYLLFYVYDERQLDSLGSASDDTKGELWIIDSMKIGRSATHEDALVARISVPQRVPYGLHCNFISQAQIASQRREEWQAPKPVLTAAQIRAARTTEAIDVLLGEQDIGQRRDSLARLELAWLLYLSIAGWLVLRSAPPHSSHVLLVAMIRSARDVCMTLLAARLFFIFQPRFAVLRHIFSAKHRTPASP
ncbi:uncharacterized protein L969DRAFT_94894 [Mixia osmundae IAM 14324]|uniref:Carotenoid oxygenase n=1 Tax=Mixia osmundae (strain CBS 9802 / IAM 14324 / JCM 22182 / KY 12970) TaxID=764103 RepID=G7E204_MIXOS|nr:uncharacterized protein L969DRAFT_94894 [Mixia osmundae IAM 14324]KEI38700.1 hypothetical protein L969DRAFT_94894 [Mixia osmundae IAM 14324]GAA96841.1 hypothetical protein E5Q_03514 [Mixia osmundae IAM 14324]